MLALTVVLALLAAALHVVIFALESVLFRRSDVHEQFGTHEDDVDAVAPWAYNQGFYNLFLAIGAAVGGGLAFVDGTRDTGLALVLLSCGSMLAAALVLGLSDARMRRAAAIQGTLPALAVLGTLIVFA